MDGFPRTLPQAENLERFLEQRDTALDCCLSFSIDSEEVVKRIFHRRQRELRTDDTEEIVRERLRHFDGFTAPLLEYYREKGKLLEVSSMGTVEEVTAEIANLLASLQQRSCTNPEPSRSPTFSRC
ncbi:adenylate kinase [Bythopirellula polymerisocia]|uniref:Adenylate kinase n=1 Tax=Bythopirellula polymerisocia TaxID=2528003 RepID=A0A5C6CBA4_9BACT|nr:adenylate kinase [Bythopirellula polymerisocia]